MLCRPETEEDDAQVVLEILICGFTIRVFHLLVRGWRCTNRRRRKGYRLKDSMKRNTVGWMWHVVIDLNACGCVMSDF